MRIQNARLAIPCLYVDVQDSIQRKKIYGMTTNRTNHKMRADSYYEGQNWLAVTMADLQNFRQKGNRGTIIAMRLFGISAPCKMAETYFRCDVSQVVAAAKLQISLRVG